MNVIMKTMVNMWMNLYMMIKRHDPHDESHNLNQNKPETAHSKPSIPQRRYEWWRVCVFGLLRT